MSETATILDPPDFTGCYVGSDGDEQARLYDCRSYPTRGKARAAYAADLGERLTEIRVTVVYARWLSRQEVWDDYGRDRWSDQCVEEPEEKGARYRDGEWRWPDGSIVKFPEAPDEPPADWQPDEYDPAWTSSKRTDPGAVRCWHAEWTG